MRRVRTSGLRWRWLRGCRLATRALAVAAACVGAGQAALGQASTGTVLTVASGGSIVTAVGSGSVVVLTAAVASGGAPVTAGLVDFCDAAAAHCTDIYLLGSAQLTATGSASIRFVPGIGSHSYRAVFAGTTHFAASSSGGSALAVTGTFPTSAAIGRSGSPGNYTLRATVAGPISSAIGAAGPSGAVSFLDTSNGNYPLASASLGAGALAETFAPQVVYGVGLVPQFVAVGDFNRDGILDLAVANGSGNTVSVLLGRADGTFGAQSTYPTGTYSISIALGDFNADGILDLAVANLLDNTVSVLLGNGDGTFAAETTYPTGSAPASVAAGDFNGDGIPDLVVADSGEDTVSVLLGNGGGTFAAQATYATGSGPNSVAVGDFNGDGFLDLAVANLNDGTVSVLLGRGDGSFRSQVSYGTGASPYSVAAGDFNGDGNLDLAVANLGGGSVSVLLGEGNGGFAAHVDYAAGASPRSVAAGDFNGDGIADLALADSESGTATVLLGKGDGTFPTQAAYPSGNGSEWAAAGDFNGDGVADLAVADTGANQVSVLLNSLTETATATATGVFVVGTANPNGHAVEASYPGDGSYGGSVSATATLAAELIPTTLTLASSATTAMAGQQVTLTATLSPYTDEGVSTNGEIVNFVVSELNQNLPFQATLVNGVATLNFTLSEIGTTNVSAYYSGGDNAFGSSSANFVTITVDPPSTATTMAVLSGGNAVTSVASGSAVTLKATVVSSAGAAVTRGTVNFCNAAAAHCTDINLLGTAQLTSSGTASVSLFPAIGSHLYKAVFAETSTDVGSSSAVSALTATGSHPTTTALAPSGVAGDYTLTATVSGMGGTGPTGGVSFLDTTNGNYALGTAEFGAVVSQSLSFANVSTAETFPVAVSVGDFNGDGKPDLAVAEYTTDIGSILLGNGDGTFTPQSSPTVGANPNCIGIGDFNGDGIPDLAVTNEASAKVTVLLGDGQGNFTTKSVPGTGGDPVSVAVADYNRDGFLDLATANYSSGTVTVLSGNGDGTFTLASTIEIGTGSHPYWIATGDFNGDGIPDLAMTLQGPNTVAVLLGNGDGTFTAKPSIATGRDPYFVVAGDFNGDGKADLAVANSGSGNLTVLLGNGDGTFAAGASPGTGSNPRSITVGDFNGDGKADLAVANESGSGATSVTILLGNGDGTFAASASPSTNANDYFVAAGDFNGDGLDDLATADRIDHSIAVLLADLNVTATAAAAGISVVGSGTHEIEASYPGDATYGASVSAATPLTAEPVATALTLSASAGSTFFRQPATLTATLSPYTAQGLGTNGETVKFFNGSVAIGTGTLAGGVATLTLSTLPVGTDNLSASYAGDVNFSASSSNSVAVVVQAAFGSATTLAITSGGNAVTSVASGSVVTLTATVVSGNEPAPAGVVDFCNALAAHCTDINLVGTAQLSIAGTASIRFVPGIGSHSYTAVFLGTAGAAGSSSAASPLTVTGAFPTATAIASSGSVGNYTLTATVAGSVSSSIGAAGPTGSVSFLNASDGNYSLASAALGAGALAQSFAAQVAYGIGVAPISAAVGDFNGDGIADLAAVNSGGNTVSVLLGKGDGTFAAAAAYATGTQPLSVAAGDFNGDGILDLAVSNSLDDTISVLLGRGDGSFGPAGAFATGGFPNHVATGDFNGDGIADLAATNADDSTMSVLLGNGDGTFQGQVAYATGEGPQYVAAGDFNGDGILDLAVANVDSGNVSVLLGNGDGTFQPQVASNTGPGPASLAVADFNGDGALDLAVTTFFSNTVSVLLGNGDGTFATPASYATGAGPAGIAVGDFNRDGIADLAVADGGSTTVSVLLGNGDGTFQGQIAYGAGGGPQSVAAGDFNGDGVPDLAAINEGSNTVSVLLNQLTETATATATGIAVTGAGTQSVAASYSGDGNYGASVSATTPLTAQPVATSLTLATSPANVIFGQAATLTATLSPYTSQGHTTDGEPVAFASNGSSLGTGTLQSGVASLTTSGLAGGSNALTATYGGDANFAAAAPATETILVAVAPTIVMQPMASAINPGQTATLTVAATGTAPLSYQWFQGTSPITANPIAGATNSAYTTPPLNAAASYWVQISNQGGVANSATVSIYVNQPPVCSLSVAGTSLALMVSASASCSDPQGEALTETINWGDGTSAPIGSGSLQHTYAAAGSYTVVATATDTSGLTGSAQQQITPNQLPVCTLGPIQGTAATYAVSVTASCVDPQGLALTTTIDWGDGTVGPAANNAVNAHTYANNGTYTVALTGTDALGLTGSSLPQPVNVLVQAAPIAPGGSTPVSSTAPPPPAMVVGTKVTFICSSVSVSVNGQTVTNVLPSSYGISCSSPTITLTAAPTPINVMIQTTSTSASAANRSAETTGVVCAVVFPLPGLALLLLGTVSPGRRRRRLDQWLAIGMIAVFCLGLTSCGGSFKPPPVIATPAGQYYVTVVETVVNPPPPTGFVQTSLIVPLPVTPGGSGGN